MPTAQAGILLPVPEQARYITFSLSNTAAMSDALHALRDLVDGENTVVGFGQTLTAALNANIPGLHSFPPITAPGLTIGITPEVVWIWLRGDDRGEILHRSRQICRALSPACALHDSVDAFKYAEGRDLSGYEDGTENPTGDAAISAAIVGQNNASLAGSSFVATQRWRHNFECFEALSEDAQDNAIGRRQSDNAELSDAPECAHVKRTAQESFSPEAFVLRRSMPWAEGNAGGLMFVAFGHSFDAFEAQLTRMVGLEDGITDALFNFTQPVSGAYYWCPPLKDGKLDLSPLGL
ncbi:Dyp-type peroxidase [Propionivibrio sp.]|uniref:Dyp-type peroxidase n=1 Tax=Propionivibrio sp. TaxID=2212460 RepID=UPI00261F6482|nr:Dyp-type peroxidase [Propionivibrio sp.]